MKKELFLLFNVIVVLLFLLHYTLFVHLNFVKNDYTYAFILLIPAILLSGYIFTVIATEVKESQDKKLEHLIKESLHEINLPISTIEANIDMLSRKVEDKKSATRINRIKEALKRLKRLYNLLSYNLKKEVLKIEKEEFDLSLLVKERIEFFQELNRNSFVLELKELKIYVDKIGLEQAIDNIIENAMKYSNRDDIIKITIDKNRLIIEDSGIGIDENEMQLVFQRYYQSDNSNSGEGIGLSIVKKYCDSEGIGLHIYSKKGIGTKVDLDFSKVVRKD